MSQIADGELLLSCLGLGTDGRRAEWGEQLSNREWGSVIRQSARHGVTALLYERLKTFSLSTNIPALVMQELREIALQGAIRNLGLWSELSRVLRPLQAHGIPVIVLKGAHLAEVVYGNRALRPMVDVDILVRKRDLSRVEAHLVEMGYGRPEHPTITVDPAKHHHLPRLTKPGGCTIEVHWAIERLGTPFIIEADELWGRARPAVIAGVHALVLSPVDLVLHLCLHTSFGHKFVFGLRSFWDIAETIRYYRDEIDWEQVQSRACQWRIGKYVYLTLRLARDLVKAAVPDEVLSSLQPDGFDPQVTAWARTQIFSDEWADPHISPNVARMWGLKKLQEKAALFLKIALPRRELMARLHPVPVDSRRIYLYYPVRWQYLLRQYARAAWGLMRHDQAMGAVAERENQRTALREWLAPDGRSHRS